VEKLDSRTPAHLANAPMLDIAVCLERLEVVAPDSVWELGFTVCMEIVSKTMIKQGRRH